MTVGLLPAPTDEQAMLVDASARFIEAELAAISAPGWESRLGNRLLRMFAARGLVDLDVVGEVRSMRGGDDSAWWSLGIEQGTDAFVATGVATREQVDGVLALMRSPDFVMMSPLSIAVRGRVPCGPTPAPVFI